MNNIKTKAVKLSLAAAGLVFAASAHATVTWIDITDIVTNSIVNNVATYTLEPKHTVSFTDFASAPVQVAFTSDKITDQSAANILAQINASNLFGLPNPNVSFVPNSAVNVTGSASISLGQHYDYLAVHFGDGEMLFHWANGAPNPFVISSDKLSNYRAFTSPVPEPETYGMLLAGLGLVGFLARRRKAA